MSTPLSVPPAAAATRRHRALRLAAAAFAPVAVVAAPHVFLRAIVLYLERRSPTVWRPLQQTFVGLGDDVLVSTLLAGLAVGAGIALRRSPRVARLLDVPFVALMLATLVVTVGSAVKVAHVGLSLMPADILYWHEIPFALSTIRAYVLSPPGFTALVVALALLGLTARSVWRALPGMRAALGAEPPAGSATCLVALAVVAALLRHETQEARVVRDEPLENHPVHYLYSRVRDAHRLAMTPPAAEIARLHAYLRSLGAEPTGNPDWPTRNRRTPAPGHLTLPPDTNVLLIVLESLGRAPMRNRPQIAPFLAKLEERGVVFDRHVTTMYRTAGAQLGILCSMLDPEDFFVAREATRVTPRCLPRVLADAGYETHWLGGSNGKFDRRREWLSYNAVQFLTAEEDFGPEATERFSFGVHDEHLYARLVDELDHARRPFFTWVLTVSGHDPFLQPASFLERHPEARDWTDVERTYRYVDEQLAALFQQISTKPWFRDTLVVLVGDHLPQHSTVGEPRDETRYGEHLARYETELLMLHPALAPAHHAGLTSHLDIAPTITGLLGLSAETDFLGEDVLASDAPRHTPVFAEDVARRYYATLFEPQKAVIRGLSAKTCAVLDATGRRGCGAEEAPAFDAYRDMMLLPTQWEVRREAVRTGLPEP